MLRRRRCVLGFCLAVFTGALLLPGTVEPYGGTCHRHATEQAALIFSFPELDEYLTNLCHGATEEDNIDLVCGETGYATTLTHFWDADAGDFETVLSWGTTYYNSWMKGRLLLTVAAQKFSSFIATNSAADIDSAYQYLGHACHLMADMTVPAHVHVDFHPNDPFDDDCYEDWMANHDSEDPARCPWWTAEDALARYGDVEVGPGMVARIQLYLGVHCWMPEPLHAAYYYLMYTGNQVADHFASDSYDGDDDDRLGLVSFAGLPGTPTESGDLSDNDSDPDNDAHGNLTTIADHCYTLAMSNTAAMYHAWRDYWDHKKPTTTLLVSGPDPVVDGWRPGDVNLIFTATDDSEGASLYDSGVHEIQVLVEGEDWQSFPTAIAMVPITQEGSTGIGYRSMDRYANLEIQKLEAIKIDKSAPVVSILSPEADGFYLTTGSFTIDYDVTDAVSGVHTKSAELDGEPVTDGQVFSDLHLMAGFHTLTVTGTDKAGNTTTESITFSIKIHATVDLKPQVLNTYTGGGTLNTHVGFPPEYDVALIDVSTVVLTADGHSAPAQLWPSPVGGPGRDGLPEMILKFERRPACEAYAGMTGIMEPAVSGELINGVEFYGTGPIQVISPGKTRPTGEGSAAVTEGPGLPLAPRLRVEPGILTTSVAVEYALPSPAEISLDVLDVRGRNVCNLFAGSRSAGMYRLTWSGRSAGGESVPAGIYFIRFVGAGENLVTKVVRVR